jgi:hypothetical protein
MNYLVDPEFGNRNGDNCTEDPEDEYDENAYYNWVNHPIRKLYDNPKNSFHQTYLTDEPEEPEP